MQGQARCRASLSCAGSRVIRGKNFGTQCPGQGQAPDFPGPPSGGRHTREAGLAHCPGRAPGPPQLSPLPAHSPPHVAAQYRLAENSPSAPGPPFLRRAPCLLPAGARWLQCWAGFLTSLLFWALSPTMSDPRPRFFHL